MLVEEVVPVFDEVTDDEDVHAKIGGAGFRDNMKWKATTTNVVSGQKTSELYDAVLVCTG